jgi:hypothetical protein
MDFHTLAAMRRHVRVKHHIPGRIRVVFDPSLLTVPEIQVALQSQGSLPSGVFSVRVNPIARSVVIEYDPIRIDPGQLEELAVTQDDGRAAQIVRELSESLG